MDNEGQCQYAGEIKTTFHKTSGRQKPGYAKYGRRGGNGMKPGSGPSV